ncbi:hypothetical protein [Klenkia terrae]|uniref:Uncharacterized protein n=1 Tax=Klenkia terrae TaxID=1052259 RepID=A0ABU8EE35_9ACTN
MHFTRRVKDWPIVAPHPHAVPRRVGQPQAYVAIPVLDGGREMGDIVLAMFGHWTKLGHGLL